MSGTQTPQYFRGIVKQVLSGDAVIIRGQPKGGPPPERQLNLSNIIAPRLARRATPTAEETKDEPWAWESREFLRKKVVGKEVLFTVETKTPTGREYGNLFLGKDAATGENLTELLISEGLVQVRRENMRAEQSKLVELEDTAKTAGKGKWSSDSPQDHVRDIKWTADNPRVFVDRLGGKPVPAVVEHVRDGSTLRLFLLPDMHHITLMLSGIRCPMNRMDGDSFTAEPLTEEAKFFTESRLLQRDIEVVLESVNNANFVGSVLHPNGNIAEALVREGFARCVDWSMAFVTGGPEKLREAEKMAKQKKIRLWKDYAPTAPQISAKDKEFTGKVTEVVNADALVLKLADGSLKKVFLSSIRPPRLAETKDGETPARAKGFRPLYDIPWMYEAREFLRKKLVGHKVNVTVDYIQPASQSFPEKTACTITIGGLNVAEAMVAKGLATVVRYRQDDDQRSSHYDELLAAEVKAVKTNKGLHAKKDHSTHRVADISGDLAKAKQFLPFLQRAGRTDAVVEFVASGSRLRLYIPRETCLITFLLGGITCPRPTRPAPGGVGGTLPGEAFGEEALTFTRELCLQREVEVEVESMDKGGNFIGWLWVEGQNLSVALVEEGLAKVHFTAERSVHFRALQIAENNAKSRKDKMWEGHEEKEIIVEDTTPERKINYQTVVVTEVTPECHFYAQHVEDGPALESLMEQLRQEMSANPPLPGSYTPRRGDMCAARFVDGDWYRARVEKVFSGGDVSIVYMDYGNKEKTNAARCAALPGMFAAAAGYAREYAIACAQLPNDDDFAQDALQAFMADTANKELLLNVEYRVGGIEYVTICLNDTKDDVVKRLVEEGLMLAEKRSEKKLQKLVSEYVAAQKSAKAKHLNLWQYGDVTEDDAKEFGYSR